MNLSPCKTKIVPNQYKPKISFVYQNTSPVPARSPHRINKQNNIGQTEKDQPRSPTINTNCTPTGYSKHYNQNNIGSVGNFLKQKNNNINPFSIQINEVHRVEDEKNKNCQRVTKDKQMPHFQNYNSSCNRMGDISKISQKSEEESRASQGNSRINQVDRQSPKISSNTASNQCSALDLTDKSDIKQYEKCNKCSKKNAAYLINKTNAKLCAECGISELIAGSQISQISQREPNKTLSNNSVSNSFISINDNSQNCSQLSQKLSHTIRQPPRSMQMQQLLSEIQSDKNSLLKLYKSFESNQKAHISKFYKDRKYKLKEHYQKIKSAIKLSIEADLKELEKLEEQEKAECDNQTKKMNQEIVVLENIETDLANNWQNLIDQYKVDQQKYLKIINTHRLNSSRITNYAEQLNSYESSSNDQHLNQRWSQNFSMSFLNKNTQKGQINLYDATTYRKYMPKATNERNNSQILFSFQNLKSHENLDE